MSSPGAAHRSMAEIKARAPTSSYDLDFDHMDVASLPAPRPTHASVSRIRREDRAPRRLRRRTSTLACAALACTIPAAMAQNCIPLRDSTVCSSFNASSVSTSRDLIGLFPFLADVSDTKSFDSGLTSYINNGFAQTKYQSLLNCSSFNPQNTTDFYARYTASVLCNAIVQNSITPCHLSDMAARPLCASSCASYAQSEQEITASNVCGSFGSNALNQIRADFTNCALPANSLSGTCIEASSNQPENCGFSDNVGSLCSYCSASSPNATDSCCVFSNTTSRCKGVSLPVIASSELQLVTMTVTQSNAAASSAAASAISNDSHGLTGGQIAGIVIGSVLGAVFLLALVIFGCLLFRRRRDTSPATSIYNQPADARAQPPMAFNDGTRDTDRLAVPTGRVARMSALESSDSSDPYAGDVKGRGGTPGSDRMLSAGTGRAPKRSGSLSSGSQLAVIGAAQPDTSPSSADEYTSPESQGRSEQLAFFKDYYSQDEIHTGDLVSTLWAYEPRAADEFQLERGDMIKVIGIWDDGWATGMRVKQKAEDWRSSGQVARDSGHTSVSSRPRTGSAPNTADGDVKAFPLVCVCLPQHWRKTIEGESTEGS